MRAAPKGPKKLAELVRPALAPVLAKQGLSQASLLLDWPVIVGERIASLCEPAKLQWPPRGPKSDPARPSSATLWLRAARGRGLEVTQLAPVIAERVNAHLGWRCVERIAIAPEPLKARRGGLPTLPREIPELRARIEAQSAGIEDAKLRDALVRLGTALLSRGR